MGLEMSRGEKLGKIIQKEVIREVVGVEEWLRTKKEADEDFRKNTYLGELDREMLDKQAEENARYERLNRRMEDEKKEIEKTVDALKGLAESGVPMVFSFHEVYENSQMTSVTNIDYKPDGTAIEGGALDCRPDVPKVARWEVPARYIHVLTEKGIYIQHFRKGCEVSLIEKDDHGGHTESLKLKGQRDSYSVLSLNTDDAEACLVWELREFISREVFDLVSYLENLKKQERGG
ncbi:MAG: hypothetical protein WC531_03955 [Candidatus Paceibacterota bacterium]|jgi:hypothetical protein